MPNDPLQTRFRFGTASWTDPSLIQCGRFYPPGCSSPEARLRYYASRFDLVEVDSSYYALPSQKNSEAWVARTPEDFAFNVKAFRLFTGHQTPQNALPKDIQAELAPHFAANRNLYYKDTPSELRDPLWARFETAIRPLADAGRLRAVLFQMAPWVTWSVRALDHLLECRARMDGYQLAVEFRHRSWFDAAHRDTTLAFLRDHGLAHVIVDEPQGFANSVPALWEVTSPKFALLRLHGRNSATWNIKGEAASERFNWDYSDAELAELATKLRGLSGQALEIHGINNNNYEDQGQRNATTLRELLAGAVAEGSHG